MTAVPIGGLPTGLPTDRLRRIVEPLCDQTAKILRPLAPEKNDWLFMELDQEHDKFWLSVRVCHRRDLLEDHDVPSWSQRVFIDGVEHVDRGWHPGHAASELWDRLPESTWSKREQRRGAPATEFNAAVLAAWPQDKVVFANEATRLRLEELMANMREGADVALDAAEFKVNRKLSERHKRLGVVWREVPELPLSDYQRAAADLSIGLEGYALFMDRGTGKTPCFIQRVCVEADALNAGTLTGGVKVSDGGLMLKVLVVCPAQVRSNWQREFERFSTVSGKTIIARGGAAKRIRLLAEAITPRPGCKFSVTICSYDSLKASIDYFCAVPWDLVVLDESHYCKDPRTDRWNAIKRLREASSRRQIMTGTPIGNSPMDLWTQLEFLRSGASGFRDFKEYKKFHGVWERTSSSTARGGVEKLIGLKNIPLLQERLSRVSFAVSKSEAGLKLPDKVCSLHEVQMLPHQAEVYRKLQDQLAVEINSKLEDPTMVDTVTVNNILTMLLRLAQVTSGFITFDAKLSEKDGKEIQTKRVQELCPTNPKVDAVIELLTDERDPKAKTIVWCAFVHNIRKVSEALTARGIDHGCYYGAVSQDERDRLVDRFNKDPAMKVLICNAQTAGEGLNLIGYDYEHPDQSDTFCDMEIFFSSNWSAIQRSQAEDRAHRRGTRMPVQVVDLVVPGTVDEDIVERVAGKRRMADAVADIREIIKSVLSSTPIAGNDRADDGAKESQ